MTHETCFVLLAPEAVDRGLVGEILRRFERIGFRVQGLQERQKTSEFVTALWGAVTPSLMELWTRSSLIGFGICGPRACLRAGDVAARVDDEFSYDGNLLHVSVSEGEAVREGELFYDPSTNRSLAAA